MNSSQSYINRFTISCLLCLTFHIPLFSQAPHGVNYQAVVRNTTGDILSNKHIRFRMTITDGRDGTILYRETKDTTTNQFGVVNLVIGKGSIVSGSFDVIKWGEVTAWLKVE